MNYQIEKTDNSLNSIKQNFDLIIEQIKITDDTKLINETIDKVKLAREWAKLQKKTEEMYSHLLRIEIECYRRIFQLKSFSVLEKPDRPLCKFFGEKSDTEIEDIIKNYKGYSARRIYWEFYKISRLKDSFEVGQKIAVDDELYKIKDEINDGKTLVTIKKVAQKQEHVLSFLLDYYASKGEGFTVEQFADELLINNDLLEKDLTDEFNQEIKNGIREVCRSAIRSAKTIFFKDKKTPRFVTCTCNTGKKNGIEFMRIPFENATLSQFQEMIDLRKEQLEQDKKALENLIEIYDILTESYNDLMQNKKIKKNQKVFIKDIIGGV